MPIEIDNHRDLDQCAAEVLAAFVAAGFTPDEIAKMMKEKAESVLADIRAVFDAAAESN